MEFLTNRKWKTTGGFTLVKYEWNDLDLALDHDQDKNLALGMRLDTSAGSCITKSNELNT